MKLNKLTKILDKDTDLIINCDKELALNYKVLHTGPVESLNDSVLNEGNVEKICIQEGKLVVELSLDYATLVRYLFEQNSKLSQCKNENS